MRVRKRLHQFVRSREHRRRRARYRQHRNRARYHGIPWQMTYMAWSLIWAKSGRWDERGPRRGQYCMARHGDTGPYAPWNVKIVTNSENCSEAWHNYTAETYARKSVALMGNQNALGHKHTEEARAKMSIAMTAARGRRCQLTSPDGDTLVYSTLSEAAHQHDLDARHLSDVARGERRQHKGWTVRYLEARP